MIPSSPTFSVVIPTYNRAELLRAALNSVEKQEYPPIEVIVVDDGSTEDLSPIIHAFGNRVLFLRQENAGPGAARNRGAAVAKGDYLAFLDSDDVWFPWTLRTYADVITATRHPSMVTGKIVAFIKKESLTSVTFKSAEWKLYPDFIGSSAIGPNCGSGQMVVKTEAYRRVGGFCDININAEDHDFALRLGVEPGFVEITTPEVIGCRLHAHSVTRDLSKTFQGIAYLLEQERGGRYPGGARRRRERLQILTRHLRPASVGLLKCADRASAWTLYWKVFLWHCRQGRLKYLLGFPLKSLACRMGKVAPDTQPAGQP